ncbi:MAG: hypothetical protein KKF41_10830 [Actinobacteria bacterium]|nr:hypothetical protein [Actinomycetota bacterium]MBU1942070.1 hypothetical protein [Actinomycetota bacterium]MBU2688067.1 hypothetical protein [Actinomycetota bacterium]
MDDEPDQVTKDLVDRVKAALDEERFQDALEICREAEEQQIAHPRLVAAESVALGELKRLDEAREVLERGVELCPGDATIHYNLSVVYFSSKRRAEARSEAAIALQLLYGPPAWGVDAEQVAVMASGTLMLLRRYREATEYLEHETARFPDNEKLRYHLGQVYAARARWLKARRVAASLDGERKSSVEKETIASLLTFLITCAVIGALFVWSFFSMAALVVFAALVAGMLVFSVLYRLATRPKPSGQSPPRP